jgi:hypothetical protein
MELLSSAGLESITLVFSLAQYGHFINFLPFLSIHCPLPEETMDEAVTFPREAIVRPI